VEIQQAQYQENVGNKPYANSSE